MKEKKELTEQQEWNPSSMEDGTKETEKWDQEIGGQGKREEW